MGSRLEVELARLALAANDYVVGLATADGNVGPRDITNPEHQVVEAQLDLGELALPRRYLIAERSHLEALGLALLWRHAAQFLRFARAPRAHLVQFALQTAPLGVAFDDSINLHFVHSGLDEFGLDESGL